MVILVGMVTLVGTVHTVRLQAKESEHAVAASVVFVRTHTGISTYFVATCKQERAEVVYAKALAEAQRSALAAEPGDPAAPLTVPRCSARAVRVQCACTARAVPVAMCTVCRVRAMRVV